MVRKEDRVGVDRSTTIKLVRGKVAYLDEGVSILVVIYAGNQTHENAFLYTVQIWRKQNTYMHNSISSYLGKLINITRIVKYIHSLVQCNFNETELFVRTSYSHTSFVRSSNF